MSLGFDAISALPFATSGPDTDVNVSVTGNQVTISIGSAGVIADSVTENLTANQVTLGLGTLSIRTDVDHTVTGSQVTLNTGNVTIVAQMLTVLPSGVDLTLATGNVTITADANITPTRFSINIRYSRTRSYYVERYSTRSNNGLDTNKTLLIWHQLIQQIYH